MEACKARARGTLATGPLRRATELAQLAADRSARLQQLEGEHEHPWDQNTTQSVLGRCQSAMVDFYCAQEVLGRRFGGRGEPVACCGCHGFSTASPEAYSAPRLAFLVLMTDKLRLVRSLLSTVYRRHHFYVVHVDKRMPKHIAVLMRTWLASKSGGERNFDVISEERVRRGAPSQLKVRFWVASPSRSGCGGILQMNSEQVLNISV